MSMGLIASVRFRGSDINVISRKSDQGQQVKKLIQRESTLGRVARRHRAIRYAHRCWLGVWVFVPQLRRPSGYVVDGYAHQFAHHARYTSGGRKVRKIEEKMVEAITKGKSFSLRNTRVTAIQRVPDDGPINRQSAVYLHDNLIAVFNWTHHNKGLFDRSSYSLNSVRCTLAGWPTVTTRSRLNAICRGLGMACRFSQRKHRQIFDDRVIDSTDWVTL